MWSPDGRYVAYQAGDGMYWSAADGGSQPRLLLGGKNTPYPESISADGRWLAFSLANPATADLDIWTAPLTGDGPTLQVGKADVFVRTRGNDRNAAFSPDGRWLAYDSTESGISQVYVRPFPATSAGASTKWQISSEGGFNPRWSRSGRELLYALRNRIMSVPYTTISDRFAAEKPRLWSEREVLATTVVPSFDLSPDAERVATQMTVPDADAQGALRHVTLVLNFSDELRRRLAVGK